MMEALLAQAAAAAPADAPGSGWLIDPELIDNGYRQTMAGDTIQTSFPPAEPQPRSPQWLIDFFNWLGDFFSATAPYLRPTLYVIGVLFALYLLYRFVPAFAAWVDNLPFWRKKREEEDESIGLAEAGAARALLSEADALASAGRFAEAVHLLLFRSIEDIAKRRPGLVKPALTSRDLAAASAIPSVARTAFSRIARAVEVSLFGGRPIDADAWQACRTAYSELTVPRNWASA